MWIYRNYTMNKQADHLTFTRTRHCKARRSGFTLAEAMLATVVLGIAAAGILLPFTNGATVQAEGMRRTLGAKLASDLMEQITTKPFHDPNGSFYDYYEGRDVGETTLEDFDNLDDFHGYFELQGQLKDSAGIVFADPAYANFSRYVSCDYVIVPQQLPCEKDQCNFIQITVRVYYSGKEIIVVNRLVSE